MRKVVVALSALTVLLLVFSVQGIPNLFAEPDTVLAKVGERVITQRDLDNFLERYAQFKKGAPFTAEEKKQHLENMVKGILISIEAEKEKLDQKPDVKSKLLILRGDVLIQEYVKSKIQPSIKVTDEELKEKLKENPNMVPKEVLSLMEILVKTEKEANEIHEQLKKGEDFSKIATEKSMARSKVHGGNVRPLSRGQLPKELEEVAFTLKKGEFSKPIKTKEGYYFLLLKEKKERSPEEIAKLEATMMEKIKQIEVTKKTQEAIEKRTDEIKKNMKVDVYPDRIK